MSRSPVESGFYDFWQKNGYFHAEPDKKQKTLHHCYAPPNITGQLHMGHALDNTLQDILTRFRRMQGYCTLWLPGTDHASIATEAKIVAAMAEEGVTKEDLGREGFLERAWEWKKGIRRQNNRTAQKNGLLLRLVEREIYHGRGLLQRPSVRFL